MSHGIANLVKQLPPQEQFKVAFLEKCAEDGLTALEILERVKQAQDMVKRGFISKLLAGLGGAASGAGGVLANYAIPAALAAPPVIGGLIGHRLAKAPEPTDRSVEDLQHEELLHEYEKQTERLKREQAVRNYRAKDSGRGGRPML